MTSNNKTICFLQEYSVPLVAGVFASLFFANASPEWYHELVHSPWLGLFGHHHDSGHHGFFDHMQTMHFWVNEVFMVLFFGIAAKEITESCLPGGALNPISKAVNPLMGTIGGIVGPVAVFLLLNSIIGQSAWAKGWGIPTATDIALAWLAAKTIFGKGHPAIAFLLLLAVADDAIGLAIIAIAYPNPEMPTVWTNALWIVPGMATAFLLRRFRIESWIPYIVVAGAFSWWGLYSAHLHPALALVFIVPFLPTATRDRGLFVNLPHANPNQPRHHESHSTIDRFEHDLKLPVDFGLFFFAFANAGVAFSGISNLTWIVLMSLIVGKMTGITLFSWGATFFGFKLPEGMSFRHLLVASCVAGIGLTVALFVSGQAFVDPMIQGAAKMGSLFSAFAFAIAWLLARLLRVQPMRMDDSSTAVDQTQTDKAPEKLGHLQPAEDVTHQPEPELVDSGI